MAAQPAPKSSAPQITTSTAQARAAHDRHPIGIFAMLRSGPIEGTVTGEAPSRRPRKTQTPSPPRMGVKPSAPPQRSKSAVGLVSHYCQSSQSTFQTISQTIPRNTAPPSTSTPAHAGEAHHHPIWIFAMVRTFSDQYLRNVSWALMHEGHDPVIQDAELKFVQRAFDANMSSSACAGWLALNRTVTALEALERLRASGSRSVPRLSSRHGRSQTRRHRTVPRLRPDV
jgi:hypothetical protein